MRRRIFVKAFLAGLASGALLRSAAHADPGMRASAQVDADTLRAALAFIRDGVESLSVIHLPDSVETRAALTIRDLEQPFAELQHADVHDSKKLARIVRLLDAGEPRRSRGKLDYDARWSLRFRTRDDRHVLVAFDSFGSRGEIDGIAIHFTGAPFVAKLAAMLPHFVR